MHSPAATISPQAASPARAPSKNTAVHRDPRQRRKRAGAPGEKVDSKFRFRRGSGSGPRSTQVAPRSTSLTRQFAYKEGQRRSKPSPARRHLLARLAGTYRENRPPSPKGRDRSPDRPPPRAPVQGVGGSRSVPQPQPGPDPAWI